MLPVHGVVGWIMAELCQRIWSPAFSVLGKRPEWKLLCGARELKEDWFREAGRSELAKRITRDIAEKKSEKRGLIQFLTWVANCAVAKAFNHSILPSIDSGEWD